MILVTGATGLIGSHLVCKLALAGYKVKVLIRNKSRIDIFPKVFSYYSANYSNYAESIMPVLGDMLDIFSMEQAFEGVTQVFNCGAIVSFDPSEKEKLITHNIEATANIVNLSLEHKIEKLIHVSSTAAIGKDTDETFYTEETEWRYSRRLSGYSISKFESEREVWRGEAEGLKVAIVNPAMVLGPGRWGESSTALIDTCYKGLKFYTAGVNAWVDIRDVVDVMIILMKSDISGERYILAGANMPFRSFFNSVCKFLNRPAPKYKAGRLLSEIVWRLELVRSTLTGKKPLITRETARTANKIAYFSTQKIKDNLDFEFRHIEDTIRWVCEIYLNDKDSEY